MSIGTWTGNSYKLNSPIKKGTSLLKDFVKIDFTNKTDSNDGSTYYIRFGAFLDYLEVNQNPQVSTTTTNPILKFDTDIESNLMYVPHFFMPCNPAICIFKNEIDLGLQTTTNSVLDLFNFSFGASFKDCEDCIAPYNRHSYLKIMNIYVNCKFILTTIDQLVSNNTNGNAYVIELLKSICDGICKSTGDLNKLKPIIDETTNTLKIIDENPLPDRNTIIRSLNPNSFQEGAIFNVQGFQEYKTDGQSSTFIRDFTMKTELTPEMATMITVGATGRGTIVGENASALSRLNNGLEDRYKKQITTAPAIIGNSTNTLGISSIFFSQNQQQTSSIGPSLQDQYRETLITYKKYIKNNINGEKPTWNEGNYSELPQIQRTLVDKAISLTQQDLGAAYTTGFIPFNLALQMDGMSGMKPYQKYTINNNFLPSNYPDLLDFYIKTITHDIANNDWTTTLESLAVPNLTAPVTIDDIEQAIIPQTIVPSSDQCKPTKQPNVPKQKTFNYTSTSINEVKNYLKSKYTDTIAKATFALMKAEARIKNGSFYGPEYNFAGIQTDNSSWPNGDKYFSGQTCIKDNGNEYRLFALFKSYKDFIDFTVERLKAKGFDTANTSDKWTNLYLDRWFRYNLSTSNPTLYATLYPQKKSIYISAVSQFLS